MTILLQGVTASTPTDLSSRPEQSGVERSAVFFVSASHGLGERQRNLIDNLQVEPVQRWNMGRRIR
jgi:hypothetical protein